MAAALTNGRIDPRDCQHHRVEWWANYEAMTEMVGCRECGWKSALGMDGQMLAPWPQHVEDPIFHFVKQLK